MSERKTKHAYEELDLTYTSLGNAKEVIDEAIERYGKDATLEIESVPDYGGDRIRVAVCYQRPETDAEMQERLALEEHWRDARRKQYEQLRKEFGE